MGAVLYRYDYAKFLIQSEPDRWNHLYGLLNEASHQRKYKAEWLKSHKVNRLWYNPDSGMETWSIDIWGEWAGLVEVLPAAWLLWLKRLDVRATIWDATKETVLDIGQHLQRNIVRHNVTTFNTKHASKRLGRDRGGVGFAIGSHKSDLRITIYKRFGEPVAQEFQCSGAMLRRIADSALDRFSRTAGTSDPWRGMRFDIEAAGSNRLARVFEAAGIGTYWPTYGTEGAPVLPPIQGAFIPELDDIEWEPDDDEPPPIA